MRWERRGHIYVPDGSRWWARRYASFPTVEQLGDVLRVYFVGLDEQNVGRTGYVDLDPEDPRRVVHESAEPVLDIGDLGTFDDCGANVFSVVHHGSVRHLYYQGWQRTERTPYLIFIGLAIDDGRGTGLRRHSRTPIMDRTEDDPFLRGAPYVLKEEHMFRMWYVSARRWVNDHRGIHYEVEIRHAHSVDGCLWTADPEPCVTLGGGDEYGVGRPSVLASGGRYEMWYSIRSLTRPYRIGYAVSSDGMRWTRHDSEGGLERAGDGWESEMVCYSDVVRVGEKLLMFYNGNQHGKTGFGYAEAVE
jgi:predicted GH43/DUF377 family glycosyl hydrolase